MDACICSCVFAALPGDFHRGHGKGKGTGIPNKGGTLYGNIRNHAGKKGSKAGRFHLESDVPYALYQINDSGKCAK